MSKQKQLEKMELAGTLEQLPPFTNTSFNQLYLHLQIILAIYIYLPDCSNELNYDIYINPFLIKKKILNHTHTFAINFTPDITAPLTLHTTCHTHLEGEVHSFLEEPHGGVDVHTSFFQTLFHAQAKGILRVNEYHTTVLQNIT